MRALGYVRVSTEEQARAGHSLAQQPERIRQWCELFGHELVDVVVDDGVSGQKALHKRKGGAEILRRLEAGEADLIVVYKLDRLFRNAQHGLNFIRDHLQPKGIQLQSISELVDTTNASGRFCLTILLAAAEYDRDLDGERTKATMHELRLRGRVYGTTPYGCLALGGRWSDDHGRMVGQQLYRDPATWPHRELIVELRGPHDGARQLSLESIADELFRRGIRAPNGGARWQKTSIKTVINSHGGLKHIPAAPPTHEPAVSEAAAA